MVWGGRFLKEISIKGSYFIATTYSMVLKKCCEAGKEKVEVNIVSVLTMNRSMSETCSMWSSWVEIPPLCPFLAVQVKKSWQHRERICENHVIAFRAFLQNVGTLRPFNMRTRREDPRFVWVEFALNIYAYCKTWNVWGSIVKSHDRLLALAESPIPQYRWDNLDTAPTISTNRFMCH